MKIILIIIRSRNLYEVYSPIVVFKIELYLNKLRPLFIQLIHFGSVEWFTGTRWSSFTG